MKAAVTQRRYQYVILGFVALAACAAWLLSSALHSLSGSLLGPHQLTFEGIEIRGDKEFLTRVAQSLQLLRQKSPNSFALVQQNIGRIRQHSRSGMRAYARPPTFDLSTRTAYHSVTWCAGAIVHDAYHSKLYHTYRKAQGDPVPYDAWSGQVRELECNSMQLAALKDIGAPEWELQHLSAQDGNHFDVNGDGNHDWIDYWAQDW